MVKVGNQEKIFEYFERELWFDARSGDCLTIELSFEDCFPDIDLTEDDVRKLTSELMEWLESKKEYDNTRRKEEKDRNRKRWDLSKAKRVKKTET